MSFQPVIPSGGLTGWMFLNRTYDAQLETFSKSVQVQRDLDYFLENIGSVTSAKDLVSDRRLRLVALRAFGLQDDIDNVYFVQRILSDGSLDDAALANRLADDRYKKFSAAFGFGPGEYPLVRISSAMEEIAELSLVQSFEEAVGTQDDTMRIALYAQRELTELANGAGSETTKWFSILGQPPLRSLFQTAMGLPSSFGQIDIDQQVGVLQDRMIAVMGNDNVTQFSDPEAIDRLITIYQARVQVDAFASSFSSAATALTLLQSG